MRNAFAFLWEGEKIMKRKLSVKRIASAIVFCMSVLVLTTLVTSNEINAENMEGFDKNYSVYLSKSHSTYGGLYTKKIKISKKKITVWAKVSSGGDLNRDYRVLKYKKRKFKLTKKTKYYSYKLEKNVSKKKFKKGKKTHVSIQFTAINEDSLVFIAFGGDYGDSFTKSASYNYVTDFKLDSPIDRNSSTTIVCSNYYVKLKSKINVKLNKKKIILKIKKQATLSLKNATSKVKWKNTNKKVISFKKKGKNKIKLKALRAGKATITAIYKGKKYKCKVTIK